MLILSVYDTESQTYDKAFSKNTESEAVREFIMACRDPQIMYSQFPEQFELHLLAEISSKGELVHSKIKTVMLALTVQQLDAINKKTEENRNEQERNKMGGTQHQ